jgi:hypothetical protein
MQYFLKLSANDFYSMQVITIIIYKLEMLFISLAAGQYLGLAV